jgi:hypothetical protein
MIRALDTKADVLLTRKQAAELLQLDPHTLACWKSQGRGPACVKFGAGRSAAIRYFRSEIERFLADPVAAEAESREPWREARRRAMAARPTAGRRPKKGRRPRPK